MRTSGPRLAGLAGGDVEDRWGAFAALTDLLVCHEVAEELVVYPVLRPLAGGPAVADSRLADQVDIERLLVGLDREEFGSREFDMATARLGLEVLAHLDKEDAQVLPMLSSALGRRRRADLGRRFVDVGRMAPAHCVPSGARMPTGRTIVDRSSALSVWIRDSAAAAGLAS